MENLGDKESLRPEIKEIRDREMSSKKWPTEDRMTKGGHAADSKKPPLCGQITDPHT